MLLDYTFYTLTLPSLSILVQRNGVFLICLFVFLISAPMGITKLWADTSLILGYLGGMFG